MSESQQPQANTPSTRKSDAVPPSSAPAAQGGQPGRTEESQVSDLSYSMETVTVDPRALGVAGGAGRPQGTSPAQPAPFAQPASEQGSTPYAQPAPGRAPTTGAGSGGANPLRGADAGGSRAAHRAPETEQAAQSDGAAETVFLPSGGFAPPVTDSDGSRPSPTDGPGAVGSAYGQPAAAAGPARPTPANRFDAEEATRQVPLSSAVPGSSPAGSPQAAAPASHSMGAPGGYAGASSGYAIPQGGGSAASGPAIRAETPMPVSGPGVSASGLTAPAGPGVPASAPSGPGVPASAPSGPSSDAGPATLASAYPVPTAPQQPSAPAMAVPAAGGTAPAGAGVADSSGGGAAYPASPAAGGAPHDYAPGAVGSEAFGPGSPISAPQAPGLPTVASAPAASESRQAAPGDSFGAWMLAVFLSALPLIGFIYLCVVSFGGSASASRRNWARAVLVWQVILVVVSAISFIIGGSALLRMLP